MAYCSSCGAKLQDSVRFCPNCGNENTAQNQYMHYTQQSSRSFYDGKVHKCPNCGASISSFTTNCPSCGYELRDIKVSESVKEFTNELYRIESERIIGKSKGLNKRSIEKNNSIIDKKIVNLISNFAIPNTREDLFEFLILASSNINQSGYDEFGNSSGINKSSERNSRIAISDAWMAKFNQADQKAKLMFPNDPRLIEMENIVYNKQKQIKRNKRRPLVILSICLVFLIAFDVVVFIDLNRDKKAEEIADNELKQIVANIEIDIANGDYDAALIKANSLHYDKKLSYSKAEEWDKQRESLIEMIKEMKERKENEPIQEEQ